VANASSSGAVRLRLRHDPHVLRVMVYAPLAEKIRRMKLRHPHEHDLQALLHRMDSERTAMFRITIAAIRRIADSTTSAMNKHSGH